MRNERTKKHLSIDTTMNHQNSEIPKLKKVVAFRSLNINFPRVFRSLYDKEE